MRNSLNSHLVFFLLGALLLTHCGGGGGGSGGGGGGGSAGSSTGSSGVPSSDGRVSILPVQKEESFEIDIQFDPSQFETPSPQGQSPQGMIRIQNSFYAFSNLFISTAYAQKTQVPKTICENAGGKFYYILLRSIDPNKPDIPVVEGLCIGGTHPWTKVSVVALPGLHILIIRTQTNQEFSTFVSLERGASQVPHEVTREAVATHNIIVAGLAAGELNVQTKEDVAATQKIIGDNLSPNDVQAAVGGIAAASHVTAENSGFREALRARKVHCRQWAFDELKNHLSHISSPLGCELTGFKVTDFPAQEGDEFFDSNTISAQSDFQFYQSSGKKDCPEGSTEIGNFSLPDTSNYKCGPVKGVGCYACSNMTTQISHEEPLACRGYSIISKPPYNDDYFAKTGLRSLSDSAAGIDQVAVLEPGVLGIKFKPEFIVGNNRHLVFDLKAIAAKKSGGLYLKDPPCPPSCLLYRASEKSPHPPFNMSAYYISTLGIKEGSWDTALIGSDMESSQEEAGKIYYSSCGRLIIDLRKFLQKAPLSEYNLNFSLSMGDGAGWTHKVLCLGGDRLLFKSEDPLGNIPFDRIEWNDIPQMTLRDTVSFLRETGATNVGAFINTIQQGFQQQQGAQPGPGPNPPPPPPPPNVGTSTSPATGTPLSGSSTAFMFTDSMWQAIFLGHLCPQVINTFSNVNLSISSTVHCWANETQNSVSPSGKQEMFNLSYLRTKFQETSSSSQACQAYMTERMKYSNPLPSGSIQNNMSSTLIHLGLMAEGQYGHCNFYYSPEVSPPVMSAPVNTGALPASPTGFSCSTPTNVVDSTSGASFVTEAVNTASSGSSAVMIKLGSHVPSTYFDNSSKFKNAQVTISDGSESSYSVLLGSELGQLIARYSPRGLSQVKLSVIYNAGVASIYVEGFGSQSSTVHIVFNDPSSNKLAEVSCSK